MVHLYLSLKWCPLHAALPSQRSDSMRLCFSSKLWVYKTLGRHVGQLQCYTVVWVCYILVCVCVRVNVGLLSFWLYVVFPHSLCAILTCVRDSTDPAVLKVFSLFNTAGTNRNYWLQLVSPVLSLISAFLGNRRKLLGHLLKRITCHIPAEKCCSGNYQMLGWILSAGLKSVNGGC